MWYQIKIKDKVGWLEKKGVKHTAMMNKGGMAAKPVAISWSFPRRQNLSR
jgi:hypothetical protein